MENNTITPLTRYTNSIQTITAFVTDKFILDLSKQARINTEPYRFLYTILIKQNNALESVNLLIANIKTKPQFLDSTFILLRTMMSDIITLEYALTKTDESDESDEKLKEQIERIYYDHLHYSLQNMKSLGSLYDDQKESQAKIEELKKFNSEYFDIEGKLKFKFDRTSFVKMMKEIKKSLSPKFSIAPAMIAYENYSKFSKHEHFGKLTLFLITRGFKDENIETILREVQTSIDVILYYQGLLIDLLCLPNSGEETKDIADYKELKKRIETMKLE